MDIIILADFSGKFNGKGNNRFQYIANLLAKDHDVEILTSDFSHGTKKHFDEKPDESLPYKVTMLHEPGYPKNVCLRRFYSHFVWGKNVKKYLKKRKKPDVIYSAVPTLTAAYEAAKYCKKNGIKFIVDIQDLWPEAYEMVFNVPIISSIIFAPFKWIANGAYKRADEIVAVSQTYIDRALKVNKTASSALPVFLGTNLDDFDKLNEANKCEREENDNDVLIGYVGTLGHSYDIECVIDALDILKNQGYSNLKFLVMGDGPLRARFEQYARDKGVDATFTGRLDYGVMVGRLCVCDIVVNPIVPKAAQSIINKHADYVASGIPVVNTQESPEYRKLVEDYNMGFNCECSNAEDMAEKIKILTDNADLRKEMGENARRCAREKFDRKNTYTKIVSIITGE
ncbi:MAG: glycosyltransferase family 4 protein [Ruminococcaceae bacterium]|nr:glycosyltransferase family 4 protein [Oscillospiraceae bacterium]